MGLLPWNDWNGDGVLNWQDSAIESSMIMFQVDEMERQDRDNRIKHMTQLIQSYGKSVLEYEDFVEICNHSPYRVTEFTQEDLDEIQMRLNRS